MHWQIVCFRLRHELWQNTDDIDKADPQPHLLSTVDLNDDALDALAGLLWAKSADMN